MAMMKKTIEIAVEDRYSRDRAVIQRVGPFCICFTVYA